MKKIYSLVIVLALLPFGQVTAQDDPAERYAVNDTIEDFGLFTGDDILNLSLRFDMNTYRRKKPKDEYMDAIMTYHISKDDSVNKNIRLKTRGEFRNGYCAYPPIVLNFKKTEFEKEDLDKIGKIKVVTHCMTGNEDYLFREYLVYKLYNVLTDTSFRVRLVNMTYINTAKESKPVSTYAFFIEPLDLLAKRIDAMPVEVPSLNQKNIIPEMMDRMAIFNYMIGNTDWSVPGQHNCKVLTDSHSAQPNLGLIVPYDFDYCGFVNAGYAVPVEGLGIESVRQRIYQGVCRDDVIFMKSLQEFAAKKEAFYNVISEFQYLDERAKKDMTRFLDEFFSMFDKRNSILYSLKNSCKEF
jgi:hypothetical protein